MNADGARRRLPSYAELTTPPTGGSVVTSEPDTPPAPATDIPANTGNYHLDVPYDPYPSYAHDNRMTFSWQRFVRGMAQPHHLQRLVIGLLVSAALFLLVVRLPSSNSGSLKKHRHGLVADLGPSKGQKRDTLVSYVFQDFDPEALTNLRFFVDRAMSPDDRCEYVVVVQRADNKTELSWLPALPTNARYVFNPFYMQDCNDWGIYGWLLSSGHVTMSQYHYFFFLNSAIRGPFFPAYLLGKVHWTLPFIGKLTDTVKLVGPSIQCVSQKCITEEEPEGIVRNGPALQNLWATDQVGLQLLLDEGSVFTCHHEPAQALCRSELGASLAVLEAGHNIDSLMLRYQGVDWQQKAMWGCNKKFDPMAEHQYDGVTVDPLETMFVRMDQDAVESEAYFALKALKYQRWGVELARGAPAHLAENEYDGTGLTKFKAWKVIEMWGRGQACFDFKYYFKYNSDVRVLQEKEAWKHFLLNGQFEGRKYRFKCNVDADSARVQLVKATGLDINM